MKKITAVIPVRAGSRRLPDKNILPFGDSNLLVHKIRQLKEVDEISEIIVSTDSEEMISFAKQEGVLYQRRPVEYCDEKSKTFNEVVEYISGTIETDILIWATCVCPLVKNQSYKRAIKEFLNSSFPIVGPTELTDINSGLLYCSDITLVIFSPSAESLSINFVLTEIID